jgi:glyoxylase-like metal-dependent hydrolase (beta-lactamase superfamily II)
MTKIRRLDYGYIVRPGFEYGADAPRAEPIHGYLLRHNGKLVLFDTGIGGAAHAELNAHYRPHRVSLPAALATAGVSVSDIDLVINCHLHFDHCGGNPLLAGKPVFVQAAELALARSANYTLPELADFPGVSYVELTGETEIAPGLWIIPTPGHTAGHQSLAAVHPDGTVVLAGQAHDFAAEFSASVTGLRAVRDGLAAPLPAYPAWLERILAFDPQRVVFAHDASEWTVR